MTETSDEDALALIGRINMNKIAGRMGRNKNVTEIPDINWEGRVTIMLEYCQTTDDKWLDEVSLNFLESVEPRLAARRSVSEKQEKWLKDLWVRYSQSKV